MWNEIFFKIKDNICKISSFSSPNCPTYLLLDVWTWKSSPWEIPLKNNKNCLQVGREMPLTDLRPPFQPSRKNQRARSNRRGRRLCVGLAKITLTDSGSLVVFKLTLVKIFLFQWPKKKLTLNFILKDWIKPGSIF